MDSSSLIFYVRVDHDKIITSCQYNYIQLSMNQNKVTLDEHSEQWKQVTYQMQVLTGQPSLKLLQLHQYPYQHKSTSVH